MNKIATHDNIPMFKEILEFRTHCDDSLDTVADIISGRTFNQSKCGMVAVFDKTRNKVFCPICGDSDAFPAEISYAFKLLLDELESLCIFPKLVLGDKA